MLNAQNVINTFAFNPDKVKYCILSYHPTIGFLQHLGQEN